MPSRNLLKAITWIMLLLFPLATFAADTGVAIVYPDHAVKVNGAGVDRSQAVLEGDRLNTAESGATIAVSGATLQMGKDSDLVFRSRGPRVMGGSLAVTTSKALPAEVVNLHVEPATQGARYLISQEGAKLVIAAMEGSVRVSDGKQTVTVEQNKALLAKLEPLGVEAASAQDNTQNNGNQNDNKKKKGAAGGAIPAAGIGVTLSKAELVTIAALAAVGGAVAAFLLTNRKPASGTR